MREIKFRGKTKSGEWVFGNLVIQDEEAYILGQIEVNSLYGAEETDLYALEWYEVIPDTVGQFTGLCANGKEIYEGDIVKVDYEYVYRVGDGYDSKTSSKTIVIEFNGEGYNITTDSYVQYEFEVIGNIHDNKDLLEVQE